MDRNYDPLAMTREDTRAWSSEVTELLMENSETSRKEAAISMTDYVRPVNRESAFCNKIFTPGPFDESERWQSLDHDQPQILIEIEPESAGAIPVDFGSTADTVYLYGKRVPMAFQKVETRRVTKDVHELAAYKYNFRTVVTDLMSLKLAFIRDERFMRATNQCLGPEDSNLDYTGRPNHVAVGGPWNYENWQKSFNVMRGQPNAIEPATVLFNHLNIAHMKSELVKDFLGGETADTIFRTGMTELKMEGDNVKMISSNKRTLIPDGSYFYYGPENQTGRYVQLTEPTMLVENRGTKVSFQLYELYGMVFVNQAAVSRSNYTFS